MSSGSIVAQGNYGQLTKCHSISLQSLELEGPIDEEETIKKDGRIDNMEQVNDCSLLKMFIKNSFHRYFHNIFLSIYISAGDRKS